MYAGVYFRIARSIKKAKFVHYQFQKGLTHKIEKRPKNKISFKTSKQFQKRPNLADLALKAQIATMVYIYLRLPRCRP